MCNGDADCPGSGRFCVIGSDILGSPTGRQVCNRNCNPLDPTDSSHGYTACGTGENCAAVGSQSQQFSDCYGKVVATRTAGASCNDGNCAVGFVCIQSDPTILKCMKSCRVGVAGDCPNGTVCNTNVAAWADATEYGICE
jgi:hypothetical protein